MSTVQPTPSRGDRNEADTAGLPRADSGPGRPGERATRRGWRVRGCGDRQGCAGRARSDVTPGHRLPGVDQLVAAFHTFRYSVFRLETLQVYAGSGEDEGIAAFYRGDTDPPPDPAEDEWAALLRANRDVGRLQQRVHVVTEPISDYLAY